LSYISENQRFAEQGRDLKQFIKREISSFRAASDSKVGTLNIKVPEALRLRELKDKKAAEYRRALLMRSPTTGKTHAKPINFGQTLPAEQLASQVFNQTMTSIHEFEQTKL